MSEYVDYLTDAFEAFGPVQVRKMFGGYGIFHEGLMIGIVADDMLYLKVDDQSIEAFKERGLSQFEYKKGAKTVGMSYYMAPEDALEDPTELEHWASMASEAARRSKK